jgi:hypothetical protein
MVLTVNTLKVAVGKEDVAYSFLATYSWFFTPVYADGRDIKRIIAFAVPGSVFQPVRVTVSWAEATILKFR